MKDFKKQRLPLLAVSLFIAFSALQSATAANEVAGVKPDSRPQGAPVITEFDRNDTWYDDALIGVEEPYPYSLRFLENQEAWYTPFSRGGMLPPYDIRGWHGK